MKKSHVSRRNFLGSVPCLALGSSTLFSSLINLKSVSSLMASSPIEGEDYKALVCVLLRGGNDSYNMLVPTSNSEYNQYAQVRSNQSIEKQELLTIDPINAGEEALVFIHQCLEFKDYLKAEMLRLFVM